MQDPRIKALLAVLGGIVSGFIVIVIGEMLTSKFFTSPQGLNFEGKNAVTAHMQSASVSMYLSILLGYIIASFTAGYVTNFLSRNNKYKPAMLAGVALMIFGILNMMELWHPTWFWVVSLPVYLVFAFLGGKMANSNGF
jgi:ABC-type Na+ efflux pump permease subunit